MNDTRTLEQAQAIEEIEKFLDAQTANARRSNKKYRGLDNAVHAARVMTGEFAEYASDNEKDLSEKFFAEYDEAGLNGLLEIAPRWM